MNGGNRLGRCAVDFGHSSESGGLARDWPSWGQAVMSLRRRLRRNLPRHRPDLRRDSFGTINAKMQASSVMGPIIIAVEMERLKDDATSLVY